MKIQFLSLLFCSVCIYAGAQTESRMIYKSDKYAVYNNSVTQGSNKATVLSPTELKSNYLNAGQENSWTLSTDLSAYPHYRSDIPLTDAIYNLSMEEMLKDVRSDGAFMAGEMWTGVWTRDISYSIDLALAIVNPEASRISLMKKVQNQRIIQDTGTGGSWPVSTDRMVWALAAWDIYKVTGDREWLRSAYQIIKNSTEDDRADIFNKETGLMKGESSFMDWREQTYPVWMEPIDIFSSQNLGTNAVHYQSLRILSAMAKELGVSADGYRKEAREIKEGINKYLWMKDQGYYAQYLYGKNYMIQSERSDALGEALCVLFDIASPAQQKQIIENTPVTEFGIPCIYPQIPDMFAYHNNTVWPFVQSYWTLAAAKVHNEKAVLQSAATIYRLAALAMSNRENMVATTGDFRGTAGSSPRQLWSVGGALSLVYRVYFGMDFEPRGICFAPFIPQAFNGEKSLSNFKYRDAILNIQLKGYGDKISSFLVDGKRQSSPFLSAGLKGSHSIVIELNNQIRNSGKINYRTVDYSLPALKYEYADNAVTFAGNKDIKTYIGYRNGKKFIETSANRIPLGTDTQQTEYMFVAIDNRGYQTFADKPLIVASTSRTELVEAESFAPKSSQGNTGYSGPGFVELSKTVNTNYQFIIPVQEDGLYAIDFRYANGSGPVNTDNKCALRSFYEGNKILGTIVFPQRGGNEWSNWGYSNAQKIRLKKGLHYFSLRFESPKNDNMNVDVNTANLDLIRVTRIF